MCYIDLEPCDVWEVTTRKARKPHRCASCSTAIQPGTVYTSIFSMVEGDASREACCPLCDEAAREFSEAHEGMRSNPSYLPTMLEDCIDEGDEESETRWAPMLAAIRHRQRQ
jgi:hypothetical protein